MESIRPTNLKLTEASGDATVGLWVLDLLMTAVYDEGRYPWVHHWSNNIDQAIPGIKLFEIETYVISVLDDKMMCLNSSEN